MRISTRGRVLLVGALMMTGLAGWARQTQKPVPPTPVSTELAATFAVERSQVIPSQCCFWFKGGGADAAVTFWKGLGIAAGLSGDHAANVTPGVNVNKFTFIAGPRYTFTSWTRHPAEATSPRYQIFVQGLFGGVHATDGLYPTGDTINSSASSFAFHAGGGLNYYLTRNWALRLVEADYARTQLPNAAADVQNDLRLSFGLVYHIGSIPPRPITIACSATPASVFPGDPVLVNATAGGLDPRLNAVYVWSGTGVTGNGAAASVATGALAPGSYTVKCGVKEGKPGKEGLKPWQSADAAASFTVKAFEPPTISCTASPSTIVAGETSTVTASGASPQNRPLSYSYSATAGAVSGNGATATFHSTGAPIGTVGITCNVQDDKGQSATASTSVVVAAPYVQPVPHTQVLCSIAFEKDLKRPARVDNEAKACLDEIALSLQKQSDARAVVVGASDAREKEDAAKAAKAEAKRKHPRPVADLAAQRAVNTKEYLVTEKGIDAARVSVATSKSDGRKVEDYLVPSGANFGADVMDTVPVDETSVKAVPREPLATRVPAKKKSRRPQTPPAANPAER